MIKKEAQSQSRIKAQFEGFVQTPPLWLGSSLGIEQFPVPTKLVPLTDESPIPEPGHGPLGKRMEVFFLFYLKHYSDYSVQAHNLQIQENSVTVGEIDFLLKKNTADALLHVELVYKVYLYDPDIEGQVNKWIGPDRRDSLIQKLNHLQRHQLPILHSSPVKLLLEDLDILGNPLQQFACFKAQLYLPKNWSEAIPLVNPLCIVGFWIKFEDFTAQQYGKSLFFSPTKPDWPARASVNEEWLEFDVIRIQVKEFIRNQRSPLLWVKKESGGFERMFVVWW